MSSQEVIAMFYSCGLEESAVAEAAEDIKPEELRSDPSWALYYYWMRHDPRYLGVHNREGLNLLLRQLNFRPEIIALNTFGEGARCHGDYHLWARKLAGAAYRLVEKQSQACQQL
ncbi:hypothetical protein HETIRDRAFT_330304 [Heterobasidion irregulare TC 32-1]|uniref:Uncharacterized protein n=1 Tax=Heterobasidion irregulare (strain TC 32-1) TaxID=747525 RepID=W4JR71_HETIT|nr:uncharacterized protein HETIRDRAFT_330304 [Heterobasidion irregulare TC 32-1]ETW75959.1 hypothetical protein HETIRDRAFT_330304 [Heterobasidion irregulare TC 32-1]